MITILTDELRQSIQEKLDKASIKVEETLKEQKIKLHSKNSITFFTMRLIAKITNKEASTISYYFKTLKKRTYTHKDKLEQIIKILDCLIEQDTLVAEIVNQATEMAKLKAQNKSKRTEKIKNTIKQFDEKYLKLLKRISDTLKENTGKLQTDRLITSIAEQLISKNTNKSKWHIHIYIKRKNFLRGELAPKIFKAIDELLEQEKAVFDDLVIQLKKTTKIMPYNVKDLNAIYEVPYAEEQVKKDKRKKVRDIILETLKLYDNDIDTLAFVLSKKLNVPFVKTENFLRRRFKEGDKCREYSTAYIYIVAMEDLLKNKNSNNQENI